MKLIPLLVGLSLAANVALVAYVRRPHAPSPLTASFSAPTSAQAAGHPVGQPGGPTRADEVEAAWAALAPDTWSTLSPAALLAQLRQAGFPVHLQRALVREAIRREFLPRHLELLKEHPERAYWDHRFERGHDPKLASAQRRLYAEQQDALHALLGPASRDSDEFQEHLRHARFGSLPAEKAEQLERVLSEYNDLRREQYIESGGFLMAQDREHRALLDREERADVAALLSPDEYREYELRSGRTASSLRSTLASFQPTEAEFITLHEAYRVAEEQLGSTDVVALRRAVVAAVKDQFDPSRIAALEQAFDPSYQSVDRIVARLNLPDTTSREVVQVQRDSLSKLQAIQRDSSLSPAERDARLAELNRDATSRLNGLLGESGFAAYRDSGGSWLRILNPSTPRP